MTRTRRGATMRLTGSLTFLFLFLFMGLLAFSCASQPPRAPQEQQLTNAVSPPQRLSPPDNLPGPARAVLRSRMASHAQDMGALMSAVMILDYEMVSERATGIAADASLARPLTGDATELNSALPERFFLLQDDLRGAAKTLGVAAEARDPIRVADAYGRLSETCVKCHATYRGGR